MSAGPQKHALPTCAKVLPKLERQTIFDQHHSHVEFSLPFNCSIYDAITDSVPSFEIDCEPVIYKPHKDEKTGTSTYVSRPVAILACTIEDIKWVLSVYYFSWNVTYMKF